MYRLNIEIFFFLLVLVVLGVYIITLWLRSRKKKKISWYREIGLIIFLIYISWVVTITLVPLALGADFSINRIVRSINYIPLVTVMNNVSEIGTAYGGDALFMIGLIARNVGGNMLLLLPLGFLAPIVWERFRRFSRIVLLGLVVSCSIELLQLIENLIGWVGRVSDIDDVIFNVIGAMIGYTLFKITYTLANFIKRKSVSSMSNYGM